MSFEWRGAGTPWCSITQPAPSSTILLSINWYRWIFWSMTLPSALANGCSSIIRTVYKLQSWQSQCHNRPTYICDKLVYIYMHVYVVVVVWMCRKGQPKYCTSHEIFSDNKDRGCVFISAKSLYGILLHCTESRRQVWSCSSNGWSLIMNCFFIKRLSVLVECHSLPRTEYVVLFLPPTPSHSSIWS